MNCIDSGSHAVIGGGFFNCVYVAGAAILGGEQNSTSGFRAGIYGCFVTAVMDDAFHVNDLVATNMPYGAGGPSGSLYWDNETDSSGTTRKRVFIN
jgi:hypothetical protein